MKDWLRKFREAAFRPVDNASIVVFRIAFGLLMAWNVWRFFSLERIAPYWLEPRFLFKYPGFSWVQPLPGNGLYVLWVTLGVLAIFIAAGFLYRVSVALFCLGYAYTFLLDEAKWLNHTYLVCLLSFLLCFIPAHRAFSVDAWLWPKLRRDRTPAWTLLLLRAQFAVVYFFAGVAKISPDWVRGEPMRAWLNQDINVPLIDGFIHSPKGVYFFAWSGLFMDLLIVPFLLWRRTRLVAFFAAVGFHLMNARLFYIGFFPWLAIAGTTLFLAPDWPRRLLRRPVRKEGEEDTNGVSLGKQRLILTGVVLYVLIQVALPLRHFLGHGGVEWWYSEHRFSWRMMLTRDVVHSYFYVTDPNTGRDLQVLPTDYLDVWQTRRMGWRPDMLVQFAKYLASVMPRRGPKPLQVVARVKLSINGREPELIINPTTDLAAEPVPFGRPSWLREIHAPLPPAEERFSEEKKAAAAPADE